jgi:hypothetical protein
VKKEVKDTQNETLLSYNLLQLNMKAKMFVRRSSRDRLFLSSVKKEVKDTQNKTLLFYNSLQLNMKAKMFIRRSSRDSLITDC